MSPQSTSKPDLLSGRTLFRAGLSLLVLAMVFFLRYSIEQGWIGPVARVALGAGTGAGMIAAGMAVERQRRAYGIMLQAAGVAVLFLTAFAAHDHYGLTTTSEAFIQLAVIAALTLALAHRSHSELLAGGGFVAAAAAPALIDGNMAIPGAETAYLATIGAAATVVFFRSEWWRAHTAAALAVLSSVAVDLEGMGSAVGSADITLELSLLVVWSMLVVVPLTAAYLGIGPVAARRSLAIVTSSAGSILFYAGTRLIYADSGSRLAWTALAVALALGHVGVARTLRGPTAGAVAGVQYIPATILAIIATVEGLTGDWVLVGLAALSIGLVVAGRSVEPRLADAGHVLFLLTAVLMVGVTAIVTGGSRVPSQLVPGAVVLGSAATIGWIIRSGKDRDLSPVYLAAAYFGTLAWLAVELPRLGTEGLALVTAGWAIVGIGSIVVGKLVESRSVLGAGFAAVAMALGKLFFIDLAEASPIVRIALFAGVGLLLAGGGYWLGDSSVDDFSDDHLHPQDEPVTDR